MDFSRLKKNLSKDFSTFKKLSVAVLGDSATQLFSEALRGYGYEEKLNLQIEEADYSQIDSQIFDRESDLYKALPQYILIFHSTQHLRRRFYALSYVDKLHFADKHLEHVSKLCASLNACLRSVRLIYFNFCEIDDQIFGNYANKQESSFLWQLRKINFGLMNCAREIKNLNICDLQSLQSQHGSNFISDPRLYVNADMVLGLDALPLVAKSTVAIIQAAEGLSKKCLIMDLDNTMWGGVIGDVGMGGIEVGDLGIGKAFTELQWWVKQLKERGVLLAVCSKNDEHIAMEPFKDHPEMVLRFDDFAVFVANWNNKVDNIKHIQKILNIGFDSMVFIDDNPVERNLVKTYLPDVLVPELPEDPAEYLPYLQRLNLFETASFTEEDVDRTKQYQEEAKRNTYQSSFLNENEFLSSLEMVARVGSLNDFVIPRVAQLTQRSNQFNLRTVRYSENDLKQMATSSDMLTFWFTLTDKFGSNGLISIVFLKKQSSVFFIDTWLMSCRVLKRGMENFVLNELVSVAQREHATELVGQYIPTTKNQLVKDHYLNLGFQLSDGLWRLDVNRYSIKETFIKKEVESLSA